MKVSIIVTTSDSEYNIVSIIENILNQDVEFFYEIIIVDNSSKDKTISYLNNFKNIFKEIKIIKNNQKINYNELRNQGVSASTGEYVCFYTNNVKWHKDKLSRQAEALDKTSKASLCFSDMSIDKLGKKSRYFNEFPFFKKMVNAKKDIQVCNNVFNVVIKENLIDLDNTLIRKSSLLNIGGFNEKLDIYDDWDVWLKLAVDSKFVFSNQILSYKTIDINLDIEDFRLLNILDKYKSKCTKKTYLIAKSNCYAIIAEKLFNKNKKEGFKYYLKSLKTFFQFKIFKEFFFKLSLIH